MLHARRSGKDGQGVEGCGEFVRAGGVEEDGGGGVGGAEVLEEEGVRQGSFRNHDAVCVGFVDGGGAEGGFQASGGGGGED
jgi:hypothetical protein